MEAAINKAGMKRGGGGQLQAFDAHGLYTGSKIGTPIPIGPPSGITNNKPKGKRSVERERMVNAKAPSPMGEFEGKVWAVRDTAQAKKGDEIVTIKTWATNGDPEGNTTAPLTKEAVKNLGHLGYMVPEAQYKRDRKIMLKKLAEAPDPTAQEIKRFDSGVRLKQKSYDRRAQKNHLLQTQGDGHTVGCTHCGVRIGYAQMELDKLIPARGYKIDNLVPACGECNVGREAAHQQGGGKGRISPTKLSRSNIESALVPRRKQRIAEGRYAKSVKKVKDWGTAVVLGDVQQPSKLYTGAVRKELYDYPARYIPDTVKGVLMVTDMVDKSGVVLWSSHLINGWSVVISSIQEVM